MEFVRGSWGWWIFSTTVAVVSAYFILRTKLSLGRGQREFFLVFVVSMLSIFGRYLMSERYIFVSENGVRCSSWREQLLYQSILDVSYVNESELKWKILDAIFWPREYIVFSVRDKYPGDRYGPQKWRMIDGVWYIVCDAYGYSNSIETIKRGLQ